MHKHTRPKPYFLRQLTPIREHTEMPNTNNSTPQPPLLSQTSQIFESLRIPDAVKDLPKFDGNPRLLYEFLANVEEILGFLANIDGTSYAKIVLRAIRNKIVGEANEILNTYGTPLVWEDIKSNLILQYSDKRNETSLIRDLHNLKQTNQSVQQFYGSIIEIQSAINNNILIHESNQSVINAKRELFAEMCLNTFLSGLKEPLGSNIRAMRPKTLAESLSFCIQEQNIYYSKKSSINTYSVAQQNIRQVSQNYYPIQTPQPMLRNPNKMVQSFPRQPYPYIPPNQTNMARLQKPTNSNNKPQIGTPMNTFGQSRQINADQRIFPPSGSGQNRQTYNNPNFGLQQYRPQILAPPEPMDVSSGYTHLRKPTSIQTHRTTNSYRPQEMNNIDISQTPYTYLDDYYYDNAQHNNVQQIYVYDHNDHDDFTIFRQTDQSIDNIIDDTGNFQSNASQNQPDT